MPTHYLMHQLQTVSSDTADQAQGAILDTAMKQLGFIPNMYANMVNVPAVLDTYLHGYAQFRSDSGLTPAEQEVVFLAISKVNNCTYCTAAHSMIADKMSKVPAPVLGAIRAGAAIADVKLAAVFDFATTMTISRGRPSNEAAQAFLAQGYTEKHMMSIVLAIAVKTLSNYSNHLFGTELDETFAAYKVNA